MYSGIVFSYEKWNSIICRKKKWLELEDIILSGISQRQRNKYIACYILMWGWRDKLQVPKKLILKKRKSKFPSQFCYKPSILSNLAFQVFVKQVDRNYITHFNDFLAFKSCMTETENLFIWLLSLSLACHPNRLCSLYFSCWTV